MDYNTLTRAELSERLFYAANQDTDLLIYEHLRDGSVSLWDGYGLGDIFSISDFNDLMPIAVGSYIYCKRKHVCDHSRDEYTAMAVLEDGHFHMAISDDYCMAIAISLLQKLESEGDDYERK